MIEVIEGLPDHVLGFEAKGEVTGEDYEQVLVPAVQSRLEESEKLSLLYVLGTEFEGYSAGALWDDTKVGMKTMSAWERLALVTDHETYRHMVKGFGFMMPAEVRVFGTGELDAAKAWVSGARGQATADSS